jgi:agmatine/peptidylarginine deiminase
MGNNSDRYFWSVSLAVVSAMWSSACERQLGGLPATVVAAPASTGTHRVVGFNEYLVPGVVLVAFPQLSDGDDPIFRIDMSIVGAAVRSGPVLVYTYDELTREAIRREATPHEPLYEALKTGDVRLVDADYDTAWIRDYGPQFVFSEGGEIRVLDARYRGDRPGPQMEEQRTHLRDERTELSKVLVSALNDEADSEEGPLEFFRASEERLYGERPKATRTDRVTSAARTAPAALIDATTAARADATTQRQRRLWAMVEKLNVMREQDDLLKLAESSSDRALDDEAPFQFAGEVLRNAGFDIQYVDAYLDGGNLLRLADGRCVATGGLMGRNAESARAGSMRLVDTLRETYGCADTIFLRALPGTNVIEHVDMFLLPVKNGVLLADYSPGRQEFETHLGEIDDDIRPAILDAAVAMNDNEETLRRHGVNVIRVPSPWPAMLGSDLVYRTVLNGVVRVDRQNRQHVILPRYKDYQIDVQKAARSIIEAQFEPGAVDYVEATAAAAGQGAIHCLTLVAPWKGSVFEDDYRNLSGVLNSARADTSYHGIWQPTDDPESKKRFYVADGEIQMMDKGRRVALWHTGPETPRGDGGFEMSSDDGTYEFTFDVDDDGKRMEMRVTRKADKMTNSYSLQRLSGEHH